MLDRIRWFTLGAALVAAFQWAPSALADETDSQLAEAAPKPRMFDTEAVDAAALGSYRGGADLHLNDITADGLVQDNHASNLTTGVNIITEGSITGAAGIPTVIQNSGNNVLIQNSTIINVQMQ